MTDEAVASEQSKAAANVRGMGLMVLGMGAFVINDTLMKTASRELPLGEIITLRGVICIMIMAPIVAWTSGLVSVLRVYSWPVFIRNIAEVGAVFTFLTALFQLPMASVTGVLQAVPLAITAAAALLLKEPVGWRRWAASGVGLVGVLLIIRPGTADFSIWSLFAITTVFFVVIRDMSTRFIPKSSPSFVITFLTAVVVTLSGLVLGVTETWIMPSLDVTLRLAVAAALVLIGYWSLIEAMRTAEISAIAPFRYTVVLWAIVLGFLVFGEVPSLYTIAGSMIVVAAGLYTLHRERVVAKRVQPVEATGPSATR